MKLKKIINHLLFSPAKKWLVLNVFLLTIIVASTPLFHPQMFRTHDFVHGVRIAEMTRALQDGHFPVRWTKNFGYGYGMPLFEFYAPLPYYFGSFWYWLTGNIVFASKLLWLMPTIIGFIGIYRFMSRRFGRGAGLVAAVLFTLAPYRAVNMYVRGAISEVWAMSFFPWILLGIDSIFLSEKKKNWKTYIFANVGLFLSHNLMTLFFVPFSLIYAGFLLLQSQKDKVQKSLTIAVSLLTSIGLSAFYIFPAYLEKDFTQVEERILSGYFHYSQHFLYIRQFFQENWKYGGSAWGPGDDISFFLGYPQLFLLIISIFIAVQTVYHLTLRSKNKKLSSMIETLWQKKIMYYGIFFLLFVSSLFFTLQKSQFVWDSISLLQVAQFPWRFLALSSLFIACTGGFAIYIIHHKIFRVAVGGVTIVLCMVFALKYFQPELYLENADALYYSDEQRVQTHISEILPDYIPIDLAENIEPPEYRVEVIGLEEDRQKFNYLVNRTHEILIAPNFVDERRVRFNVADYPGWIAMINGEEAEHEKTAIGLIEVVVPAGSQTVGLQLQSTPVRLYSDLVSLATVLVFLFFIVEFRDVKKNRSHERKKFEK